MGASGSRPSPSPPAASTAPSAAHATAISETSRQALEAAQKGDQAKLLALIQQGFAVDTACSSDGQTALHAAARYGRMGVVEALVQRGANMDAATSAGNTPLKLAASKGHVEVAAALLAAHASVNAANANGYTPLHAAVGCGCVPLMGKLLDAGANIDAATSKGHTPLHQAAQVGQPQVIAVLLSRGAAVDLPCKDGHTALRYAAQTGHREVVQQLVQAGAAVNAVDNNGLTALHAASATGQVELAQLLLDSGADPSMKDRLGWVALHYAAQAGCVGVVTRLLQQATDLLDATASNGITPLQLACTKKGSMEVLQQLLAAGADPAAADLDGATALHHATTLSDPMFMQRLLEAIAAGQRSSSSSHSIDAEFRGVTPLLGAVESRNTRCVELLLEAGADPDRVYGAGAGPADGPSLEGATALHRAVDLRFMAAVPLLATPANMCRLWKGKTPLHLALSSVDENDWFRDVINRFWSNARNGSIYRLMSALLEAGSPAGVPDADGNTALVLAARSLDFMVAPLVPAMVRNECRRYKQLLEAEQGQQPQQQQQGGQQQDASAVKAGIVDGLYALLVAAAAGAPQTQQGPPSPTPALASSPPSSVLGDHPASSVSGDHPPSLAGDMLSSDSEDSSASEDADHAWSSSDSPSSGRGHR